MILSKSIYNMDFRTFYGQVDNLNGVMSNPLGLPLITNFRSFNNSPLPLNTHREQEEPYSIWSLCEEISSKKEWYSKVFRDEIVNKWKDELSSDAHNNFEFALKLLRATAQGTNHVKERRATSRGEVHYETCGSDERHEMCNDCKGRLKQAILNNLEEFSLSPEDIEVDFFEYEYWADDNCNHPLCKPPDSSLNDYIEYHPQGLLDPDLHQEFKSVIAEMAAQEPIDWHPGSNQQVRDLIHPSMNCYVKGVSIHDDGEKAETCEENVRYQWLPSEFCIGHDGKVVVETYINNLKAEKYPQFIPMIQKVFERFFPSLEYVLHKQIRDSNLQVIVKVGSIILDTTKPNYSGSSWHVEGMPYEHIAATCIHYVNVDNITDSFLEFRIPTK